LGNLLGLKENRASLTEKRRLIKNPGGGWGGGGFFGGGGVGGKKGWGGGGGGGGEDNSWSPHWVKILRKGIRELQCRQHPQERRTKKNKNNWHNKHKIIQTKWEVLQEERRKSVVREKSRGCIVQGD